MRTEELTKEGNKDYNAQEYEDYQPWAPTTIVFEHGEMSKTISIELNKNKKKEDTR